MRYQIKHAIVKYASDLILQDINFEIHDTEKIAVVGRNGCGKTTLLRILGGFLEQDEGHVYLDGEDIITDYGLFIELDFYQENEQEKIYQTIFLLKVLKYQKFRSI